MDHPSHHDPDGARFGLSGGFYFFIRALRESRWATLRLGMLSVALFATLLGVATIMHWDRFDHRHFAFWLWAGLYFSAPFLVILAYLANRRYAAPPRPTSRGWARSPDGS